MGIFRRWVRRRRGRPDDRNSPPPSYIDVGNATEHLMIIFSMTMEQAASKRPESGKNRVLVVGMGVSGIATATRLRAAGWAPVIIERAAERRRGGYFIGLFEAGMIAADRLGVLGHLHDRNPGALSYLIDRSGHQLRTFSMKDLPGRPWLMLRGDVEQAAFATLPADVEVRYSTIPTAITQDVRGLTSPC